MSRRTIAIAAALSVLALGSPLITGCANPLATNFYNSGVEKYEKGDYQGAIADFNNALDINPQLDYAYNSRGNAKGDLKDYQGAIADYSKAIEINPEFASAYRMRWINKELIADLNGACRDWRKAADFGLTEPAEWAKNQC